MITNKELKRALLYFKEISFKLNEEWGKVEEPRMEEDISYKYPFHKSFDELVLDIGDWVDTHTKR